MMKGLKIVFSKVGYNGRVTAGKTYVLDKLGYFKDDWGRDRISPLPNDPKRGSWLKEWKWKFIHPFNTYLKQVEDEASF